MAGDGTPVDPDVCKAVQDFRDGLESVRSGHRNLSRFVQDVARNSPYGNRNGPSGDQFAHYLDSLNLVLHQTGLLKPGYNVVDPGPPAPGVLPDVVISDDGTDLGLLKEFGVLPTSHNPVPIPVDGLPDLPSHLSVPPLLKPMQWHVSVAPSGDAYAANIADIVHEMRSPTLQQSGSCHLQLQETEAPKKRAQ